MSPQANNGNTEFTVKLLVDLLNKGHAHVSFEEAVHGLSVDAAGKKLDNLPYTIWQITEHIRVTQWDILEFSKSPDHISPPWPEGYWPVPEAPATQEEWENCIRQILGDRKKFIDLLEDPKNNMYEPFPYGEGQSLLREALVIADHTSYHVGEIIIIRRLTGEWNK